MDDHRRSLETSNVEPDESVKRAARIPIWLIFAAVALGALVLIYVVGLLAPSS
jgi:hypothetical protein